MKADGNVYFWPDIDAVLDETAELMEWMGHDFVLNDRGAFEAGLGRARTAADYDTKASIARLAALMFDGIATRHALMDGNKRAGAIAALTFMDMNGQFLDASEMEFEAKLRARVAGEISTDDLAAFFTAHLYPDLG